MSAPREVYIAGGVATAVVAETGVTGYLAIQDADPRHEEGRELLVAQCADPAVQESVADAVEARIADSTRIDPDTVTGAAVNADGTVDVAGSAEACTDALNYWGSGVSSSARQAALEVIARTNPELAARINELSGYVSPWAFPAAAGALAILAGAGWVFKEIFISSKID